MTVRVRTLAGLTLALVVGVVAVPKTAPVPAQAKLLAFNAQAKALLARMTLEEKVGQMTQPDQLFIKDVTEIEKYGFGSVLSGGDSDPKTNTRRGLGRDVRAIPGARAEVAPEDSRFSTASTRYTATATSSARSIFPHNVGLGATRDAELVEEIGRITAEEVRATGINWAFAPCVAVPRDERWGRDLRGLRRGSRTRRRARRGRGARAAGRRPRRARLACSPAPSTIVGDGGTVYGTGIPNATQPGGHYPPTRATRGCPKPSCGGSTCRATSPAIQAGVAIDHAVLQQLERREVLGPQASPHRRAEEGARLRGLPDLRLQRPRRSCPATSRAQIEKSINAGMDMVMVPEQYIGLHAPARRRSSKEGRVPMSRIDDAVGRILRVKFAMGLMEPGKRSRRPTRRYCRRLRLRRRTAPSRGRRCGSRWCC